MYLGLNRVMQFEKFTAYFNQPISTTLNIIKAAEFSKGVGIILKLGRFQHESSSEVIPKYFDVRWLSGFNEDERLFYGENVVFRIIDIYNYDNDQITSHKYELKLLNLFQKIVRNKHINWNDIKDKMIQNLILLIQDLQNESEEFAYEINDNEEQKFDNSPLRNKRFTEYGTKLFEYFCRNKSVNWVGIKHYYKLPIILQKALLFDDKNEMSITKLCKLFVFTERIIFNDLALKQMNEKAKPFINAMKNYILCTCENDNIATNLKEVTLESKLESDGKANSTLRKLANQYSMYFMKFKWTLEYTFRLDTTHTLIFSKWDINDK